MSPSLPFRLIAVLSAVAIGAACGGVSGASAPGPAPLSTAEVEALYRARSDSARMRFTEADVRFMTGMIGHHAQAVVMARLAPVNEAGPLVRTLAGRIISAQEDEIVIMQQWLRERAQPVPEVHFEGTHVMMHGTGHEMSMPGMLTAQQMRALETARGAAFDRLFLTYMIQHHRGAVAMVHELFATEAAGQDEAVFKFASDVQVDQTTEIARMERLLSELSTDGRTP